jgi:hypothetical protein
MRCGCGRHQTTMHKTPRLPDHFRHKVAWMITQLDPAEGVGEMLTIDASALLVPPRPFTDDELTDVIAAVIDDLDARVIDPSLSTSRSDSGVRVEVSMTIDTDNPWVAQAEALAAMRDAFDSAVPAVAGVTHELLLQEA